MTAFHCPKPFSILLRSSLLFALLSNGFFQLFAEDGYDLWLRYDALPETHAFVSDSEALGEVHVHGSSDTLEAAASELHAGLSGLLGATYSDAGSPLHAGPVEALPSEIRSWVESRLADLNDEGFLIARLHDLEAKPWVITGQSDLGVLYGAFAFLRSLQDGSVSTRMAEPMLDQPRIRHRMLNHWDNLTRTTERVQAGQSIWEWFQLPDYVSPRYRDYARANASIGVNATVLTNVNANAVVLTPDFLAKTAAIADALRPYGIRTYLTARFSAPMEIGGLKTADPLDPEVQAWWNAKINEIYQHIPDFGGFLVKANSEGQPGPQDYGRSHADGANLLADALAPHGGIVIWRAFVYTHENTVDRHKQAYDEFVPLDGEFRKNVIIQVKNGAIDFMPREPFHPMFGAMPGTPLGLELQITQEYLGGAIHLAFLAPLFEEVLDADTHISGEGSTVARIIEGAYSDVEHSMIAGVSNIGTDRNWTGHPLLQSNWYAFGRLAWDPKLSSDQIASEWIHQTFGSEKVIHRTLKPMLLESREAVVEYSMPLGLHHIMARGHHYGPGPWVDGGRPDWTSVYYHQASSQGIGFDRTASGSNALKQYSNTLQEQWSDPQTIPVELLLWFHHLPWDYPMPNGLTLWQEMGRYYQRGVNTVRSWLPKWESLKPYIDAQLHHHVEVLLKRQEREAVEYKDACLTYFHSFHDHPWPETAEPAAHGLDYYRSIHRHHVPGNPSEH